MLGDALGGTNSSALVRELAQMLAGSGGLGALVQAFERNELGHIVASWISSGQNLPISPDQLKQVLGQGQLAQIAQSLGLQPDQVATQLSHVLPHVVDKITPGGQLPADGVAHEDVASASSSIMAQFGKSRDPGDVAHRSSPDPNK